MVRLVQALALGLSLIAASLLHAASPLPPQAVSQLAPTGNLRAAINFGNPVLAVRDGASGEPRGVSVDLARELAQRLGVPVVLVLYPSAGKVVEALSSSAWDVAFVAIDPGARRRHGIHGAVRDHRGRVSRAAGFIDPQ
jgi:polar amino acid transport system substrate-binding protein